MNLNCKIDNSSIEKKYVQLYQYIKKQIISGGIEENEKLPSVRQLAKDMSLSITTIENAYNQLLIEGYLVSKARSGYYVNKIGKVSLLNRYDMDSGDFEEDTEYPYDFISEYIEENNFDFGMYKKHINQVFVQNEKELYRYGDVSGESVLKKEIGKYLSRNRGITAPLNRIIIGAGIHPLLNMLSSLLDKMDKKSIAFESPGFGRAKNIFENRHFEVRGIKTDENGIDMNSLFSSGAKVCYVSPSHQFPVGHIMPINNRIELISWAKSVNGYIIEDDYNSELRYEGQPIAPLKEIDNGDHVVYLGSFSTMLVPSIRISYVILPKAIYDEYEAHKEQYAQTVSRVEQIALSKMMAGGDLEKHIRKVRKYYAKKRKYIIKVLKQYLDEFANIQTSSAGLHVLIELRNVNKEETRQIVEEAKKEGVLISCLEDYLFHIADETDNDHVLILNYRGIAMDSIEEGIRQISKVVKSVVYH